MAIVDLKYTELHNYVRDRCKTQENVDKTMAHGVGWALSMMVDVPGRQDADPSIIFEEAARPYMSRLLNEFNEQIPFNVDVALEIARFGWLTRYNLICLGPDTVLELPVLESKAPFLVAMSNMSGSYNAPIHTYDNANQTLMITVINRCAKLLRDVIAGLSRGD